MNLLRLKDISFSYESGTCAISELSLGVEEGEVLALLGPSGCGKSTLLSIIAGLYPYEGGIYWGSRIARERDPARRLLTMMFQSDTVLPWLTVERNVSFGLRFLKLSAEEKARRVDELIGIARLEEFRRAYPRELSGGMRRRTALLMSVAPLPRLLLLDEPFAALDEPTRIGVHQDLLEIVYRLGISVVLVTHDVGEAVSLADRVCVLTRRPARAAVIMSTEFGHERNLSAIRERAAFQEMYGLVWSSLREQTGGTEKG